MSNSILFIGVDLHKEFCQIAVLKDDNSLSQHRVPTEAAALRDFFTSLEGKKRLVVEACGNWYFFHRCVAGLVDDFALAHPLKVKAIASARIKTDKIDAATLAHLLRADLVPRCYIPSLREIEQREILRHRSFLVRQRAQIKCRLRATLLKLGLRPPIKHLWGARGKRWLAEVRVPDVFRFQVNEMLALMRAQDRHIEKAERRISRELRLTPAACALTAIAGIGPILALTITAEMGDVERFPSPAQLVSYAGLAPSTYSSGGRTVHGRITKQGSRYLRWAFVEAAIHAWRGEAKLARLHERIKRRKGSKTARTAVARKLLEAVWLRLMEQKRTNRNTEAA